MNSTIKILLLEDSPEDVGFIKYEFKKSGWDVVLKVVQTREEYIESLTRFLPDLILSDYSLPAFDGFSAYKIKMEYFPNLPFIVVSGVIGEENAVQLIKSGITDYVLKNNLVSLISKIKRALNEAEAINQKSISDELIRLQNERLFEIASLQSHQVHEPATKILSLLHQIDFETPNHTTNHEILKMVGLLTKELDEVILQIVKKTEEIKRI